jgi:hypothetical protein
MESAGVELGEKILGTAGSAREVFEATETNAAKKTMPNITTQADELNLKCWFIAFTPNNQRTNGDQALNRCRARAIDVSEHSTFRVKLMLNAVESEHH